MLHRLLTAGCVLAVSMFAQEFKVGGKVADFKVQDLSGKETSLAQLKGDVTVVTFVSVQCPISNDYNERMKAVFADYKGKVNFLFLNANHTEPAAAVAQHAKEVGFAFPVYKDGDNVVANRFGASVTPESYVIDKAGTLVYHGYIDDARNPARITNQGLRKALDAVLTGKAIEQAETKAFGCTIKKKRSS
jgi:cytochrome oxidase Cu insertion factor (SCO1/SenC/PrrC family)